MRTGRRTSLQRRFFIFTLTFSLVILAVTMGLTYYSALQSVAGSTSQYLGTYIAFADQAFTDRLNSVKLLSHTIASDQKIVQAAIALSTREASYDWFVEQLRMRSYLDGLIVDKSYVQRLAVIMENGAIFQSSVTGPLYLRDLDLDSLRQAMESTVLTAAYDEAGLFRVTRPIMVHGVAKGTVYMELDAASLFAEYAVQPLAQTSLFILDEAGRLIHTAGPVVEQFDPAVAASWDTGLRFTGGHGYFLLRHESGALGMTVIGMLTLEALLGDALRLGQWMLILALAAALAAAGIAWLFSRSLFGNLNILMDCMRAVRKGDLTRKAVVSTRDEISDAADAFNAMMDKIQRLMADIRVQEAAKRAAEQQMLEAQIQPHFVYNSISAMQYAAQMRGQTDIEQAAAALGELMRSVLGNHTEWITLWEERTYIEQYIVLQRFKFKNGFTLRWAVDEPLWAMTLPKLLVQPLVENALIHGIHLRDDGEIVVSAHRSRDRVLLQVTDNGKGMAADAVAELMDRQVASMRRVGIANVRERIELCYHGQAQFSIMSVPGSFTCVELNLPAEEGRLQHGAASSPGG